MKLFLIILLMLSANGSAIWAADRLPGPISAEVLRVVDGDTIAVRALIWPGTRVEVKVRLAEVNAPELFRPSCKLEKQQARLATTLVIQEIGEQVQLREVRLGKYAGRVVARIHNDNGQDIGELLLIKGLAHEIGDNRNWCKD